MYLSKLVNHIVRKTLASNIRSKGIAAGARYFSSDMVDCEDDDDILCCGAKLLRKSACPKAVFPGPKVPEVKPPQFPFKDLLPDCCTEEVNIRFDDLYYQVSDKRKRTYHRTWIECPDQRMKVKKKCCLEDVKPIPIKRRPPNPAIKKFALSGCANLKPSSSSNLNLMKINIKPKKIKCRKLLLKGCKSARNPPSCTKVREKTICKKRCTPHPSFSESPKPPLNPKRKCEGQDESKPMCEIWADYMNEAKKKRKC